MVSTQEQECHQHQQQQTKLQSAVLQLLLEAGQLGRQQAEAAINTLRQELQAAKSAEQELRKEILVWTIACKHADNEATHYKQQVKETCAAMQAAQQQAREAEVRAQSLQQQRESSLQANEELRQRTSAYKQEMERVQSQMHAVQQQLLQEQQQKKAAVQRAQTAEAHLHAAQAAAAAQQQHAAGYAYQPAAAGGAKYQQPQYAPQHQVPREWPYDPHYHHHQQWHQPTGAWGPAPVAGTAAGHAGVDTGHIKDQSNYCQLCTAVKLQAAATDWLLKSAEAEASNLRSKASQLEELLSQTQQQAAAAEAQLQQVEASGYSTWLKRKKQAKRKVAQQIGDKDFWVLPGGLLTLLWMNNAEVASIKTLHRLLSKACHPDKNLEDGEAHAKQQSVNLAWEFISSKLQA